ncbi:MAG TPA: hypothetical protein VIV58_29435 [Kofleriaceae bacterium]
MRTVLFTILVAGCTTSTEHSIYGTYETNFDGVTIHNQYGEDPGGVVEVTASDPSGYVLDDAFFHSESIVGPFAVQVPDGSVSVHLVFKQFTAYDGDHTIEAIADGPITGDVDAGLIVITTAY